MKFITKLLRSLVPHVHVFDSYVLTSRIDAYPEGATESTIGQQTWRAVVVITRACSCGTLSMREQYGQFRRSVDLAREDEACMIEVLETAMPKNEVQRV